MARLHARSKRAADGRARWYSRVTAKTRWANWDPFIYVLERVNAAGRDRRSPQRDHRQTRFSQVRPLPILLPLLLLSLLRPL